METEETEGGEIFSAVMAMKTAVDAAIKAGDISQEAVRIYGHHFRLLQLWLLKTLLQLFGN